MRESHCYFFCHTPKKWGYGTPTPKSGVRVPPVPAVSYAYAGGCPPILPNPISPNPYMLGLEIGSAGLGIGLVSGFDYFRQYNVIRRIGVRRNGAEPTGASEYVRLPNYVDYK